MKRRLLITLAAVSLLLAVAVSGLWVMSHLRPFELNHSRTRPTPDGKTRSSAVAVQAYAGVLGWLTSDFIFPQGGTATSQRWHVWLLDPRLPPLHPSILPPTIWRRLGFSRFEVFTGRMSGGVIDGGTYHSIPFWAVVLPLLVAPVAYLMRWRRARRLSMKGGCRRCGYDLRATRDRCPECGTPVTEEISAAHVA